MGFSVYVDPSQVGGFDISAQTDISNDFWEDLRAVKGSEVTAANPLYNPRFSRKKIRQEVFNTEKKLYLLLE